LEKLNRQARPLPLSELPPEYRAEIERLALAPKAPPRWIYFGREAPGSRPLASIESRAWYEWHRLRKNARKARYGPSLARSQRLAIIQRDGLRCQLCGEAVPLDDIHIDHIVPRSLGGSDEPVNLRVAHARCNIQRGNRLNWSPA